MLCVPVDSNVNGISFKSPEIICFVYKLYNDFKNFNKRFKRFLSKKGYKYEYIITVEAQERGAFHLHGIFIFNRKAPYIDNKIVADIWGLGFVSIKSIDKNIDNIGKYLTAYLTDFPIDNDLEVSPEIVGGEIKEISVMGNSKKIIKGARLKMLPVGIRLFRHSRGIKKPTVCRLPYGEAIELVSKQGFTKVGEYALEILDIERDFKSNYVKQIYKKHINTYESIC